MTSKSILAQGRNRDVDTSKRPITHISHCYGYGGIDIGLQRVFGPYIVTIVACEIEAFAIQNGLAKSEAGLLHGSVPFHTDIKSFPFGKFRELVDIYSAGFPCQPFSCAGARKATEDPRHLFPFIKAGLIEMQPEWVFLENVDGIFSAKIKGDGWNDPEGTPILLHVLRELERVGYEAEAGVFSAAEAGAPHQRKRVFILGRRKAGKAYNKLPVLSLADGQCWGCPVGANETEWEALRRRMVGVTPGSSPDSREGTEELVDTTGERAGREPGELCPEECRQDNGVSRVFDNAGEVADTVREGLSLAGTESESSGSHDTTINGNREEPAMADSNQYGHSGESKPGIAIETAQSGASGESERSMADSLLAGTNRQRENQPLPEDGREAAQSERLLRETEEIDVDGNGDSGRKEVGNTECDGLQDGHQEAGTEKPRSEQGRVCESAGAGSQLEHAEHDGQFASEKPGSLEGTINGTEEGQDATGDTEGASRPCSLRDLWPSRPGEAQGIWEPPRVTTGKTKFSDSPDAGQLREEESEDEGEDSGHGRGPDSADVCGSDGEAEDGVSTPAEGRQALDDTPDELGQDGQRDIRQTEGHGDQSGNAGEPRGKEGTVANADSGSDGNGRPLGSGDRQGRKPAKSRTSGIQQERKVDGNRPEPAGGDTGSIICGGCGFKNSGKWKRTKCLVCGKELADAGIDGRTPGG